MSSPIRLRWKTTPEDDSLSDSTPHSIESSAFVSSGSPSRAPSPCRTPRDVILSPCSRTPSPAYHWTRPFSVPRESPVPGTSRLSSFEPLSMGESPSASRSEKFWYDDGTVVIRAEDTLYKVYGGILIRQSDLFKSKITTRKSQCARTSPISRLRERSESLKGPPDSPELDGRGSEDDPIVVKISKTDFELILTHTLNFVDQLCTTSDEWARLAGAARALELTSIYTVAVRKLLVNLCATDLIDVGFTMNIRECYLRGFGYLVRRDDPLSLEEGRQLGVEHIIAIAQARDRLAKGATWSDIESSVTLGMDE